MSTLELLAYAAPLVAIAVFLFTPPGQVVVGILAGTRIGRWAAIAAAIAYVLRRHTSLSPGTGSRSGMPFRSRSRSL